MPSDEEIGLASAWCGEPLLWDGEDPAAALAPGSWRRMAFDDAQLERQFGAPAPSAQWRSRYALALGLSRLDASGPVQLPGGVVLAEHQAEACEAVLAHLAGRLASGAEGQARCWIEHATGSGKTVTAAALAEACRGGGTLILTHRSSLVDQFAGELRAAGLGARLAPAPAAGKITVQTYAWMARNFTELDPDGCQLIICDEAHQSLGPKAGDALEAMDGACLVGMTATGQLIAKGAGDLFQAKVSTFDLRQAARLGVISPLRCWRVPPGLDVQAFQDVRIRAGDFDEAALQGLLNRGPVSAAAAAFYRDAFPGLSGVVYAAGVDHADQLALAFIEAGVPAAAVNGRTPRRELRRVLDDYEAGRLAVIVNAQLLTEGWSSFRAQVCLHLAPTASRRVYQQRIGRVTRRAPGKEAGLVVDFVPPGYRNGGAVVTLHSLLGLDEYRGGALVTSGPEGRGEPAGVFGIPAARAPVSASPEARARALMAAGPDADLPSLAADDLAAWAQIMGEHAASEGELAACARRLDGEPAMLVLALGAAAKLNSRRDVAAAAGRRLADLRSPQALDALLGALRRPGPPDVKLIRRALRIAAEGVPCSPQALLEAARALEAAYLPAALAAPAFARAHARDDWPRSHDAVALAASAAMRAPAAQAAAVLACLPPGAPGAPAAAQRAVSAKFGSSRDLAGALLDGLAPDPRAAPGRPASAPGHAGRRWQG